VEPVGEPHEDASAHQPTRGGGELGVLVCLVGRFDEVLRISRQVSIRRSPTVKRCSRGNFITRSTTH
jgi:hypothetical protein